MFYMSELSLLCDVFHRNHINALSMPARELSSGLSSGKEGILDISALIDSIIPSFEHCTVYKLTDSFGFCYRFLLLPASEPISVLAIGPYLEAPLSDMRLLELAEGNGISPQKQKYLHEYYATIPVLKPDSPLWTMLNAFCERIWHNSAFAVVDIDKPAPFDAVFLPDEHKDSADTLLNMRALERRYAFENELMYAVEQGKEYVAGRLLASFQTDAFEKRAADPLRNAKNYGIIMNTLLRKAAERGGVHPVYLDRTSSGFALRVENMSSLEQAVPLMYEMFQVYCRLVREHSIGEHPEIVKRALLLIDADLTADLSPRTLALALGVSLGYLCSVFKESVGLTLTQFVREKRLKHAAYLLSTTNLQIQTVALHCGILDVQYFSKLFKAHYGRSPSQYRGS